MELKEKLKALVSYRNSSMKDLAIEAKVGLSTMIKISKGQEVSEGTLLKVSKNLKVLDS